MRKLNPRGFVTSLASCGAELARQRADAEAASTDRGFAQAALTQTFPKPEPRQV
jgi:hypothetical protein